MITYQSYLDDIIGISSLPLPWKSFNGKNILITGATGLIGSCLVDVLGYRNKQGISSLNIYVMSRSFKKIQARFPDFCGEDWFIPVIQDITTPLSLEQKLDYIVNCASNAHPRIYAEDPIGTITTNIFGLKNLLDHTVAQPATKIVEMSSVEIYGSCNDPLDDFSEPYCGHLDCNAMRAGYPESKRVSEALCQAYIAKYGTPVAIARPCRVYGPTMEASDSKATAQFFKNALSGEDIVLKSKGNQVFSYAYMGDIVSGILYILFHGKVGEAYNIADRNSVVTLAELAEIVASGNDCKVRFDLPDQVEQRGFSGAVRAVLLTDKLEQLGWRAQTDIREGVRKTISILKETV